MKVNLLFTCVAEQDEPFVDKVLVRQQDFLSDRLALQKRLKLVIVHIKVLFDSPAVAANVFADLGNGTTLTVHSFNFIIHHKFA